MRSLQVKIARDGALVDILVGLGHPAVQLMRSLGQPIPQPVAARAILDTAAEATCLDPQVLTPLVHASGIQPSRFALANLPASGGLTFGSEYAVGLTVVHPSGDPRDNLVLRTHAVLEVALGPLGYQALIGRDILDRLAFFYDGPGRALTLIY